MEPVGVAFAAFSLFSELEACGKSLCRFSRDIRMAKKEVKLLKQEISNCRLLASIFEEVIRPVQNKVMQIAREEKLDQRLRDQSKLAHDQIREITHKLRPLHRGKSTGFTKLQAKIRWHFTKDDLQFPMATLGSVKSSLNLLTTLSLLDSAVASFSRVPNSDHAGRVQALEKITALEKQARRTERQFSDSMKVLHEQGRLDGQTDSAGNTLVITIIIKDIGKGTIKDARNLVKEFSNQSQVAHPTNPDASSQLISEDYMYSQPPPFIVNTSSARYPGTEVQMRRKPKSPSLRSRSFTCDNLRTPSKKPRPLGSEAELCIVVCDQSSASPRHSGLVTVEPEVELPVSHAFDDTVTNIQHSPSRSRSMYQAMPPFNESDLQERETRNRRHQSRSRSQKRE
ncbi:hypothetical protein PENCOP_c003G05902 [Penicillium coprophilum]|uniref:Fungal N-terminal domain-containing protein n=1 Tax=Penicillium coprophilum TaxID=36646 RepID=A0A1V6UYY3_9EURO|nr:hypothetical protein PENCOP_c003G05902 [Penicillium coprophilum]